MIKNYNDFELQHSNTRSKVTTEQRLQNFEEKMIPKL